MKMLIVGLDGATFDIIKPLMNGKELPNLEQLIKTGAGGELRSTVPPVTAPAWSSFMTGTNPGKHGIFQWRTYDPSNYTCVDENVVTAARLAGRTFWDLLGSYGYKVGIITVPITYPPWQVNGYMLSGYPCPDTRKNFTSPAAWADSLMESYNFSADYYVRASEEEIWQNGLGMLEMRTSLAMKLIREQDLDVCVLVLGEIDRAQHDFWKYTDPRFDAYHTDRGSKFREVIAQHYQESDKQIGRLLELTTENTIVIIMSDHGAGPHPPRYFYTNSWLKSLGLLGLKRSRSNLLDRSLRRGLAAVRDLIPFEERLRTILPAGLVHGARRISLGISSVDWSLTRAYRFPMYHPAEGIEINLRGRQPEGIVEPGAEYEELRDYVLEQLKIAVDPETGEPIVEQVYRREELYSGRHMDIAPDIVFLTASGYRAERDINQRYTAVVPLDILEKYSGLHDLNGIFVANGGTIERGIVLEGAEIVDVAPTALYALGVPVPREVDGRILMEIFRPSYVESHPPQYRDMPITAPTGPSDFGLSEEEEQEVRDKLRGLGYLS